LVGRHERELRALAVNTQDDLARAARRLRVSLPVEKIAAWFRFSMRQTQVNRSRFSARSIEF
jgi:hypothetical protein